ncbi:c-type cytochrome biogenesis protein CcmI [Magnetovibrio sp. PR-2]|uniref:c-type cytochrome biogenesis protein CcmI n=1 Tax=Magnetovibrio sp. PR-2 TaxID=3120356 RepID=UPI002FCDF364
MTLLWVAVAACILGALAFLIVPLARRAPDSAAPERAEFDLTVYKDQLGEIERDMERGVLSEDQALAARTEIERRMLAAAEDKNSGLEIAETRDPKMTQALMIAIMVILPLGALGTYLSLGQPSLPDQPLAQRQMDQKQSDIANAAANAEDRARAMQLLKDLEERLAKEPNDVEGWLVLAEIYEMGQRYGDAAGAYEKVAGLTNRHPQALAAWAEALIIEDGSVVSKLASDLLVEVQDKDPADPRSYFYLALAKQQKDDLQGALDEYVALLKVSPENAEWVAQIQSRMQGLAAGLGIDVPQVTMLPPMEVAEPEPAPAPAPGPTAEQVQDAQQMSAEDQNAMIQAMVERLADKLKENPDDLAGWKRLAQAYRVLGNAEGLAEAEANIKRLGGS